MNRPTLIYKGDSPFVAYWAGRWGYRTGEAVEYLSVEDAREGFSDAPDIDMDASIQYVDESGHAWQGADAVFHLFQHMPRRGWLLRAYKRVPAFSSLARDIYRIVDSHPGVGWRLTRLLWGSVYEPAGRSIARWLFLRNLGLIFLVAFLSLNVQIEALIGEEGILPAPSTLELIRSNFGADSQRLFPSLLWRNASNDALHALCLGGALVSVFIVLGTAAPFMIVAAWVAYLSIQVMGRDFLSFQWDILLLETAFLAIFLAPLQFIARPAKARAPSKWVVTLVWLLLFRLTFASGVVKLDDETWTNLSALTVHYQTQPLPTALGWYAHQLPEWFHKLSVVLMFVIEIGVPFLIVFPRRVRHAGGIAMIGFQCLIILTGNYCFFNWLTIALCLMLFDDQFFRWLVPRKVVSWLPQAGRIYQRPRWLRWTPWILTPIHAGLFVTIVLLSLNDFARLRGPETRAPELSRWLQSELSPYRVVNSYGLFAHMTVTRPEIVIEGSMDGENWEAYEFKWKPGDLTRRPRLVAPHQPRLDWQMWFAALGTSRSTRWFSPFMVRLLDGEPVITQQFAHNPFPDAPPKYIRALLYEYEFEDRATKNAEGRWWKRELVGTYFGPASLSGG